jgi:hypothetical protein
LSFAGCYATTDAYVDAEYPPVAIETYPHTYYDGQEAYLVGDRWYVHNGGGWVFYRTEPDYLYRYRTQNYPHYYPAARRGYHERVSHYR